MARLRLRLRITPRLRLRQDKIMARPGRRERGEREVRGRRRERGEREDEAENFRGRQGRGKESPP